MLIRRYRYTLGVSLVSLAIIGATLAAFFHDPIADAAARFLVRTDPAGKADLIYLLGGDYLARAPVAAELFNRGLAPKILIAREPANSPIRGTSKPNFSDITVRLLVSNGVPANRIIQFLPGNGVRSTADEARALSLYLSVYPAAKILVVTSPFHTRRARLALARAIPRDVRLSLIPAAGNCTLTNWRQSKSCRHEVTREWVKLCYYFCTFF